MTRVRLVSILSVDLQVEIRYEYEHDLYLNSLDRLDLGSCSSGVVRVMIS